VASRSRADRFDLAIVGGGAAGCVLARRLADRGDRRVVLIEAGPDLRGTPPPDLHDGWHLCKPPDWGFESEPGADGATRNIRRGRVLGGTSWLTRFAVRGAASDFDAWAAAGNPGWTFADVLPTFRRLEADHDFGGRPWHGDHGPITVTRYLELQPAEAHATAVAAFDALGYPSVEDHNAPGAIGIGRMPMSTREGRRVVSVDAYLPLDRPVTGLTIRADLLVDRVRIEGGRATGIELADGTFIAADAVVLAAGTYGSPSILLRSGIGPAADLHAIGIAVRVDLPGVGSNLADHPGVDLNSGWQGEGTDGPLLHTIVTFRSGLVSGAEPDMMFWVSDPEVDDPALYFDPIILRPRSRGSVRLRSADPVDPPRIALPGLRDPLDVERLMDGYRRGVELANHAVFRRVVTGPPPSDPGDPKSVREVVLDSAYSIPHVVGTCAMGPSPADGAVVDALGRVHGVPGLAVVDASIMPEPPSGFPHLITLMLAEHLADRLATVL
jgi:choline dehydrogenase